MRRASARPRKRRNPQIKKDYDDNGGREEFAMVGAIHPAHAGAPNHGCEDDDREQKEDARDFQPYDGADPAERPQKAAYAFGDVSAGMARGASRIPRRLGGADRGGACGPRRGPGQMLPRRTARHPYAYAQYPANGLRLHPFMMLTAFWISAPRQLPIALFRHRN